jgi:hypothetical protein
VTEILHALLDVGLSRIDRGQWAPKLSDVRDARFRTTTEQPRSVKRNQ